MLVVVGGHSRNIGKTSVAASIIRALPEARWTAVKITQHGHGICSLAGEPCSCAVDYGHPYAISEEATPNATDSGRFLEAGAERSYWLRTPVGQLGNAMPELRRILASAENAIFESNSVMQFLKPDLYLVVLDFSNLDMKESSRRYFDRADGFAVVGDVAERVPWEGVLPRWLKEKPCYRVSPPSYENRGLVTQVASSLGLARQE